MQFKAEPRPTAARASARAGPRGSRICGAGVPVPTPPRSPDGTAGPDEGRLRPRGSPNRTPAGFGHARDVAVSLTAKPRRLASFRTRGFNLVRGRCLLPSQRDSSGSIRLACRAVSEVGGSRHHRAAPVAHGSVHGHRAVAANVANLLLVVHGQPGCRGRLRRWMLEGGEVVRQARGLRAAPTVERLPRPLMSGHSGLAGDVLRHAWASNEQPRLPAEAQYDQATLLRVSVTVLGAMATSQELVRHPAGSLCAGRRASACRSPSVCAT